MQLKKIKLAGFKSFVDPTTIFLPSNLVAVVGPNGCGKSNIIDAICWVMGESSAKYLRGESLTDVIFNGSSARKPVGLASVELVFDNQDGSIGGEYTSYAEISIRRQISRDAESIYFLNGARCRRRDIISIFLGTGLGPRSYSIIGQNMISRVVEAKPEEMRVYLEEAAGVSKYKERRRETENRIHHAKENLARLNDIRAELERQLSTLKRQANAAERFKTLKQEERILRARWFAAQWRQLDALLVDYTLQIQQQETGLEARQAELSSTNLTIDHKRDAHRAANELFQEIQRRYYTIGNEITRVEQNIQHHQERQRQWQVDLEQADKDWLEVKDNLEKMTLEHETITQEIIQLEPDLLSATGIADAASDELAAVEEAMQEWQNNWDEFNEQTAKTAQTAQVEQTRIQHLEQQLVTFKQQQTKLEQEHAQFDFVKLQEAIAGITQQVLSATAEVENYEQQLGDVRQSITTLQSSQQRSIHRLDEIRNEVQQLRGQQASLEALQQTALGQRNNPALQWLSKHQLDNRPRLAQNIEVEAGWEDAVEKVLGVHLQAVCVDELAPVIAVADEFDEGNICIVTQQPKKASSTIKANTLLSKVKSAWPIESLLAGIYITESRADALALCNTLEADESVMTRNGMWLSSSWLRMMRDEKPEAGVFQREQELKQLASKINSLLTTQHALEKELENTQTQLVELTNKQNELQKIAHQHHAQYAEVHAQQKMQQQRLTEFTARVDRIRQEQEEMKAQWEQAQSALKKTRSVWQQAITELDQQAQQRATFTKIRDSLRERLQAAHNKADQTKEAEHQLEIRIQTSKSQQTSLQQSITRMQAQLSLLAERKTALQQESKEALSLELLEKKLAAALTQRLALEGELNQARTTLESLQQEQRGLEIKRQEVEREMNTFREALEKLRIDWQGLKVKAETVIEQLNETGFELETILPELPHDVLADEWHAQLEQVSQRITRLGAINLVAIEEYTACEERKHYLDKQYNDLQEGLNTLENAIEKIDKETRARFKETFDKVNETLQDLFPKIFGGGRAYLELTGENLLDTGITVMACPPGKRNSTIHLLSGGEKAMTAIALVFSIFRLNPAPFCLLDEVDAPLDDINIGRFCQLVKTMADNTQFLFISHNKLAIEMAEHLLGVTMHEPGVSRLVSVDVQEAISLAGA